MVVVGGGEVGPTRRRHIRGGDARRRLRARLRQPERDPLPGAAASVRVAAAAAAAAAANLWQSPADGNRMTVLTRRRGICPGDATGGRTRAAERRRRAVPPVGARRRNVLRLSVDGRESLRVGRVVVADVIPVTARTADDCRSWLDVSCRLRRRGMIDGRIGGMCRGMITAGNISS